MNSLKSTLKHPLALALFTTMLLLGLAFFVTSKFSNTTTNTSNNGSLASTSVKIVRSDRRSGGTGVIYRSYATESHILTNSHVCEVVENGGLVITENSTYAVTGYLRSKNHDVCMVKVAANLGVNTYLADATPEAYSEAIISGHPRLLPNVVTRGHFSGREIISIMTGLRKCTEEDMQSENGVLCMMIGGIPRVTSYEAQLVTSLIQPGSSGSAVFNSKGQISGLAFAGSAGLSYAYIVPYEAVVNFITNEAMLTEFNTPNNSFDVSAKDIMSRNSVDSRFETACANSEAVTKYEALKRACALRGMDMLWRI